jgi:hypothetical protein
VTLETPSGRRDVAIDQLVEWGTPRDTSGPAIVVLGDGSELSALAVNLADDDLTMTNPVAGRVTVAIEHVAAMVLESPTSITDRDRLIDDLRTRSQQSDRVWTRDGDVFSGALTSISATSVTIDRAGASFDVPTADVRTIALDASLTVVAEPAQRGVWCGLADGSRLLAQNVTTTAGNVQIEHAGVSTLSVPVAQIVWLLPLRTGTGITYVSDLEPTEYVHVPLLGRDWPYRLDISVAGTPLRAGGRRYVKGLGLHSASRLSYDLAGQYRRFESLVAIDEHVAAGGGSVVFRVRADGKVVYESLTLRSGDPPQPVSVDVTGAQRITLEVDYADRGHVLDRADWLGARLVK